MPADALVILTKAPEPGRSKTRLVPPLTAEEAAALAKALLIDQLENAAAIHGIERFVAYTPESAADAVAALAPEGFRCFAQEGRSLGERMSHAFEHLFARGARSVILIGSDLPPVPRGVFHEGFAVLAGGRADVVLGPSADGGYYLVGMNRPVGAVFEDITWSRADVLSRTIEKLKTLNLNYELLPSWYDIDTATDLRRLESELDRSGGAMKNTAALLHAFKRRGRL